MGGSFKKIIASITLVSFIGIVFFSFAFMHDSHDGNMTGDCPFSATSKSLCGLDSILSIIHHIGAYGSFTNVPIPFVFGWLAIFLMVGLAISVRFKLKQILAPPGEIKNFSYPSDTYFVNSQVYRWLSLLENSPSLS